MTDLPRLLATRAALMARDGYSIELIARITQTKPAIVRERIALGERLLAQEAA
jgi:hypothetical protein